MYTIYAVQVSSGIRQHRFLGREEDEATAKVRAVNAAFFGNATSTYVKDTASGVIFLVRFPRRGPSGQASRQDSPAPPGEEAGTLSTAALAYLPGAAT